MVGVIANHRNKQTVKQLIVTKGISCGVSVVI